MNQLNIDTVELIHWAFIAGFAFYVGKGIAELLSKMFVAAVKGSKNDQK